MRCVTLVSDLHVLTLLSFTNLVLCGHARTVVHDL